nr:SCP2 sterol-binding domain-containing protein [Microvirga brassicacearum]
MFERLGAYAGKRYGLAASDLPFAFVLDTSPATPMITATRSMPPGLDARISGPFLALLGIVDGTYDGDALFFSRTIVVDGDVEAVLALRNAIDDAGVDVLREGATLLGPLGEALLRRYRQMKAREPSTGSRRQRPEWSPWN